MANRHGAFELREAQVSVPQLELMFGWALAGPAPPPQQTWRHHVSTWEKVAYPKFETEPVWAQSPYNQPSKVYPSNN